MIRRRAKHFAERQGAATHTDLNFRLGHQDIDADARIQTKPNRSDYIDPAAPGVDVWAEKAGGGSYRSGTSFAAPFVVAAIAIEQSAAPGTSAKQLFAHLRAGA